MQHLLQVFNAWAKKKGVNMEQYRFLNPDGNRVNPTDTPAFVRSFCTRPALQIHP